MNVRGDFARRLAVQAIVLGAVVATMAFVGVRFANARPGVVGSARTFVTVAGTLSGVSGATMVTFEFERREGMTTTALCAPIVTVTPGTGDAFSVAVPLDDTSTPRVTCPEGMFDGRDVYVRALVGGREVAGWAPVNPVPYAHFASVAGVASQYGAPLCPYGYTSVTATVPIVCRKGNDEVVRVGDGLSAFWIDRYEASIWTNPEGTIGSRGRTNIPWGTETRDFPEGFPDNGQWSNPPRGVSQRLYAVSRSGVIPTRAPTWFQAQEACRLSGKRLPTGEEWLAAAQGTDDPGSHNGDGGRCRTMAATLRETGAGTACVSHWGAVDMVGNLAEWTDEWYAAPSVAATGPARTTSWPPGEFRDDRVWNVDSRAVTAYPSSGYVQGIPAATQRGGDYGSLESAGIFAMLLSFAPSTADQATGFRCVIPR